MQNSNRRNFFKKSGAILATGVLASVGVSASEHKHNPDMEGATGLSSLKGVDAFVVSADEENICATCRYWGGARRATEDKKSVHCESLGWCNNPDSHNYQTKTTPVTGPMKAWRKWEAL